MANPESRAPPDETGGPTSDRMLSHLRLTGENSLGHWVLIGADRWIVATATLLLIVLGFVVLGTIWTDEFVSLFAETGVVQVLLVTLLSGIILLVSIAVSVNSIVLSQEITALGEQEEQIDETFEFRDSIRENTEADVSPARPAEFLRVLLRAAQDGAEQLRESVQDGQSGIRERIGPVTDDIVEQVDEVEGQLERGTFGTSDILLAGMNYDYSWQVYALRRLRTDYDDELTDAQLQEFEDLLRVLKYFSIGREYFKTLYFKRELANLSRWLLATALPSIVILSYALLTLQAGLIPEVAVLGIPSLVLFVGVAYTIGLVPYTLFSVYVFRSATIANRTLAAGPFLLKGEDKRGRIDWETDEIPE